jgi:NAD(P)-dependent dehydrogenase (short-subunit alcohol dehydrogenase family)
MSDERPVALVTGAGSGIGRAACRALARRERGAHRLVLVGRRGSALRETGAALGADGDDWVSLPADIGAPEQARQLPDRAAEAFGRLDAVINNAGWSPLKPAWELSDEEADAILSVNAIGPILISIAAVRLFRAQNAGRLVQVSSMASDDPFPGLGVYGAAKASLNTLTRGLVNELGDGSPIRAFCVAPGAVETDLLRSIIPAEAMPTEACLTPESVAEVIADCASGARDAESGRTIWMPSP